MGLFFDIYVEFLILDIKWNIVKFLIGEEILVLNGVYLKILVINRN